MPTTLGLYTAFSPSCPPPLSPLLGPVWATGQLEDLYDTGPTSSDVSTWTKETQCRRGSALHQTGRGGKRDAIIQPRWSLRQKQQVGSCLTICPERIPHLLQGLLISPSPGSSTSFPSVLPCSHASSHNKIRIEYNR